MTDEQLKRAAATDIRFWAGLHQVCPNCGIDFRACPPEFNLFPHYTGTCKPATECTLGATCSCRVFSNTEGSNQ